MKKLFILTAVFSAMFLMMSCGGSSSSGGDGYTQDGGKVCTEYGNGGECKGHEVRACVENENAWYEVSDINKKFECDGMDCTQAAIDLNNYCYDTGIDYDEEDGATCVTTSEPDTCGGKAVKTCTKDDSYWYEVDGKKFECKEPDSEECTQALLDYTKYCSEAEESAEGNEGGESTFATEPEAYLPASYADKTLDAWYMLKEADEDKIKIEAVFLFNDNTLVVTSSKVYSVEDGREPEKEISAEGTFEITSGDYDNGEAHVVAGEMEFDVTISDGILSAMDAEFAKQDNADAPEAQ
ncbi:hypothetical protein IKP13_06595 [bacterium]|nr:hypothetical protein [bacterium]